jgi:hypothetical protein
VSIVYAIERLRLSVKSGVNTSCMITTMMTITQSPYPPTAAPCLPTAATVAPTHALYPPMASAAASRHTPCLKGGLLAGRKSCSWTQAQPDRGGQFAQRGRTHKGRKESFSPVVASVSSAHSGRALQKQGQAIGVRGRCQLAWPRKCQKQMGGVQGLTCAKIQRSPWTSNHGGGADVPHSPAT